MVNALVWGIFLSSSGLVPPPSSAISHKIVSDTLSPPSELQHITLDGSHTSVWGCILHLPSPPTQPFLVQNNME